MSDPEQTDPNPNLRRAEAAGKSILAWSHAHTVATAAFLGFVAGWLLPKVIKWFI